MEAMLGFVVNVDLVAGKTLSVQSPFSGRVLL